MAILKLKVKKTLLKRKVEGVMTEGYYGRVITNGTKAHEEIALEACKNTTLHKAEAKLAMEMFLDSISENLKQGYIVDLGPIGKLYPAVSGNWETDPDALALADMKPHVNYRPSDDIKAAIGAAVLSWAKAEDEEEETDDTETPTPGDDDNTEL